MPVRVLLLDDDLVFASEARTAFLAAGCEVEVLDDGSAAVLRAGEQRPDVVIASAELPGINGFRLCTRLKKAHEGLAVVLTFAQSSASGVASHQRLVSCADAYVPRSVALHELVARVRSLSRRSRSDSPASSRRKTGAPSSRPRSRTPAKASTGARSVRPPGTIARVAPVALPPPPAPARGGAPRPDATGNAEKEQLRKAAETAKGERDEMLRTLQAARTDAEALRRALDQARTESIKVRAEADEKARAATSAEGESLLLGAALAEASRERDARASELEASRARIAKLEQQLVEADNRPPPASERLDQRIAVLQRAADAARLDREEARAQAAAEQQRAADLEAALRKEQAARADAEQQQQLAVAQAELGMDDPATVEGRVQGAIDLARREHALEMTRLRGEHAAVVFQLRHELAALRGTAKVIPGAGSGAKADPTDVERFHAIAIEVLKAKHEKELEATRANLMVMMRRVESLEAQVGEAGAVKKEHSGEHLTVAGSAPGRTPPPVPAARAKR